ncbi:hypothetical protein GF312_21585 [Candidatus Poribacteria bacterium]|nr:hypothetical protein [Candidatus Poribacteria bacterium]
MIIGLATNARPVTILKRTAVSFAITALLGYMLISVIQKYTKPLESAKGLEKDDRETMEGI